MLLVIKGCQMNIMNVFRNVYRSPKYLLLLAKPPSQSKASPWLLSKLRCLDDSDTLFSPWGLNISGTVECRAEIATMPTKNSSDTNRTWQGGQSGQGARIRSNMVKQSPSIDFIRFDGHMFLFTRPHLLCRTKATD